MRKQANGAQVSDSSRMHDNAHIAAAPASRYSPFEAPLHAIASPCAERMIMVLNEQPVATTAAIRLDDDDDNIDGTHATQRRFLRWVVGLVCRLERMQAILDKAINFERFGAPLSARPRTPTCVCTDRVSTASCHARCTRITEA